MWWQCVSKRSSLLILVPVSSNHQHVYVQYIHVLCTVPYNMIHIRVVQKNEVKLFQVAFASFCSFWRKNYFCKISCDLRKFYHCHKAIVSYSIHA